ncbi:MAG: prepilin-type N-terminal cleavage/methylation domain-containing protein, partial [Elusimicrobiaceae bacterium]|nr:prepilin-type N-terminal cleavage/methylation domain-containing protein [Elusimicrobiaceae bacterium]
MRKGFTLIELLVVVLIIGILSAVALPQYKVAVEKSRATELMVNVKSLADAVDLYYLETGAFPTALADLSIQLPGKIS